MTSAARLAANRANAQKSTGPRTAAGKLRAAQNGRKSTGPATPAGKKRSSQNARRHGLTLPPSRDPGVADAIRGLAQAIAGTSRNSHAIALAMRIADAEIALLRARRARLALYAGEACADIRRLAAIEYYERRARARRKFAIRALDAAARSRRAALLARQAELRKRTEPNVSERVLRKRTEPNLQPTPPASSALR
jgi:hypothetical protein